MENETARVEFDRPNLRNGFECRLNVYAGFVKRMIKAGNTLVISGWGDNKLGNGKRRDTLSGFEFVF